MVDLDEKVAVTGRVLITDTNRLGFVTEIAIETDQFEQYVVHLDEKGKQLTGIISEWVRAEGIVIGRTVQGQPVIKILSFNKRS
jgi:hypothetical protein